ncbi:MAG: hypothetical protein JW839_17315 [Candidatus Lokiarchaeota archaeon]|nr:hypothetical protein [Candidatus Lokiarchaeota archaeon]
MHQKDMINVYKTIPLLCAFTFALLLFVLCFCVKETISALPLFASYIDAGQSVFFPFIPQINLFFFLPEDAQVLPFTIGHVIDFIIIMNLVLLVNPVAYPYYKKISHEYQQGQFYDLHIGCARARQRTPLAMLDVNPKILVSRHAVLDGEEDLGHGCVAIRSGSLGARWPIAEAALGRPAAGHGARLRSRPRKSTGWRDPASPSTRVPHLYRSPVALPGREVASTARAVSSIFGILFAPITIFSTRYRQ